nr:MAG TPA: hypothetical protein [Caudoviricetes sp.]
MFNTSIAIGTHLLYLINTNICSYYWHKKIQPVKVVFFGIQKEVRLVLHSVKALALLEARSDF